MKNRQFSTTINAPREKVWKVLWTDETYRQWTAPFHEGSYAVTDWQEGSKVHFLSPEGDGMYSTIARNIPNEYMSIRHIGEIKNGEEQPLTDETRQWSGAHENYTLKEENGITNLIVDFDIADEHFGYFQEVFPKALAKVKELAEQTV